MHLVGELMLSLERFYLKSIFSLAVVIGSQGLLWAAAPVRTAEKSTVAVGKVQKAQRPSGAASYLWRDGNTSSDGTNANQPGGTTPNIVVPKPWEFAGATECKASVSTQEGVTYTWDLSGGTITSGQGSPDIHYTVTAEAGGSIVLTCAVTDSSQTTMTYTLSVSVCPLPTVAMKKVEFASGIPVSYNYGEDVVPSTHWESSIDVDVKDGEGSKRPAVYLVKGKGVDTMSVNLSIADVRFPINGRLVGTLPETSVVEGATPENLVMEGDLALANTTDEGELTVPLRLSNLPDGVHWYRGDVTWKVVLETGLEMPISSTRLEVFVVLDMPDAIYQPKGVWPEVLRAALTQCRGLVDNANPSAVLGSITDMLHWSSGFTYDTMVGASNYIQPTSAYGSAVGGIFELKNYLQSQFPIVNCYDQAGAVQAYSGAFGISCEWLFDMPFGFLAATHLIGIGDALQKCNNPFFDLWKCADIYPDYSWATQMPSSDRVPYLEYSTVPPDPTEHFWRTSFGNHAFIGYDGKIFDSCAGPHLGTETVSEYLASAVDGFLPTDPNHVLYDKGNIFWQAGEQPALLPIQHSAITGITGVQ